MTITVERKESRDFIWHQKGEDEMRATGRYVTWSVQWIGDRCGLFVEAKDLPPFKIIETNPDDPGIPGFPLRSCHFGRLMDFAMNLDGESVFLADLVEAERARLEALRRAL